MDTTGFAVGAVTTGFSYPVVARYNAANGVVTYSDLTDLARGVSFNPQIVVANSNNIFYANNQAAERGTPKFSSGTVGLTVDGLLIPAEQLIMGIPGTSKETITVPGHGRAHQQRRRSEDPLCGHRRRAAAAVQRQRVLQAVYLPQGAVCPV